LLIYLDSCIAIYLVEQPPGFGPRASARVGKALTAGDKLIVSDLTRLECRAHPLGAGNLARLGDYDTFFSSAVEGVAQLTTAVCDRATAIRGHYRFETPDSLHLAAAIESGCQFFLTNDTRLSKFTGVTVEVLP
jgi:predicted nucleic acid-binding protein